ncbi:MAG TPA: hypothetical protein VNI83_14235, partial [Vicinamibacterales bacterium]|nr:hypothetical protein [Vicinamibacterales bacterium]
AGAALARAQDEYAASLRAFPDAAPNQTALAWLEMARGKRREALAALDLARRLDPRSAEPLVVRGVLLAREGRLEEAIAEWEAARTLDPADRRPPELIAAARRRLGR